MTISTPSFLKKSRHGIYYFRVRIPTPIRNLFASKEILRSLGTGNRQEALRCARILSVQVDDFFEGIRTETMTDRKYNRMDWIAGKMIRRPDGSIEMENIQVDADNPNDTKSFMEALGALDKAKPVQSTLRPPPFSTTPLQTIIDAFCEEKMVEGSWRDNTENEYRATFQLFRRIVGDIGVNEIGYETALSYKQTIQKLPPNINKIEKYRGKTIEEIIAMKPTPMAINTMNKNLNRVASLFDWAKKHGFVNNNCFSGNSLKTKKLESEERAILSKEDLKSIFKDTIFTKKDFKHTYYYWTPLIALHTGARLGEICQLYLDDIRQEKGIWIFDINDKDEKMLKTPSSKRLIPVHSKLVDLGLLKYADKLRAKGETRLFPELVKRREGYGQDVSRWFSRFRKTVGVTDEKTNFHSFRHTVADSFKQKGIPYERASAILGHKDESETYGRYGKALNVPILQPVIEELKFGDVLRGVGKFR